MLDNLRAAMAMKRISALAIAQLINVSEKTVNNKLSGVSEFTLPEALSIKSNLFPEYDLCYLFAQTERTA